MKIYKNITIAFAVAICLTACELMFIEEPGKSPIAIFENFWQTFKDDYGLFEERNIDWDANYETYRPQVNNNTSDAELYTILTEMIAPFEDGHVALMAMPHGAFDANKYLRDRIEDELFDLSMIKQNYLDESTVVEGAKFVYGKIKLHNIAYIFFDVFRADAVKLDEMWKAFPDVNGYIVDLRHNNGGDVSFSYSFLGKFIQEDKFFLRSKTKNGRGANDYSPWFNWYLKKQNPYIAKPLIILTDRYTVSAAERMVMAAKTLPNAIIMGDTTNGTFGTKVSRELVNGWTFAYSIQKVEMFDGKSYEGIGLSPDVWVKNEVQEMKQGIDRTLQTAINKLY
ncbi:MAG: S41 family peptidase [Algoriphagus sp.]|uniref:S41 family peptidase n=1 Tax=Algoriphagus sp. TaxID=1872435 RepID=UPI00272F148F|nr:S41 family peptidase [Algoriphagus sp.]MDP2042483.1 S41 family peptidase [Algoriphagus sp.]MDP3473839.1 S41 family peptidase [Algoriphagus sp.]